MTKLCSEVGCSAKATVRSLCKSHYTARRKAGTMPLSRNPPETSLQYLLDHKDDPFTDECLTWPFAKNKTNGHGTLRRNGKSVGAHRLMCELVHGAPPFPKAEAAHSCGKGHEACVHPRHLSWKTRSANLMDKVRHGTDNRGEKHYASTLTEAQVLAIAADTRPANQICMTYPTSGKTVHNIRSGVSWAWLTGIKKAA